MRAPGVLMLVSLLWGAAQASAGTPCERVGDRVLDVAVADKSPRGAKADPAKVASAVARRCDKDRWSTDAQACFTAAVTTSDADRCLDRLTKDQRTLLAGDADRLGDTSRTPEARTQVRRFVQWLERRPAPVITATPVVATTASSETTARARLLYKQGLTAYQTGRYELAIQKFAVAAETNPAPELLYNLAQAYRLRGDRHKALEQYEKYLETAPAGAASDECREQIEKLRVRLP
jgi:tetratricopeptide (TPR) repeat protein